MPAVLFAAVDALSHGRVAASAVITDAIDAGATGLSAIVRVTADGVAVLAARQSAGPLRKRTIARTDYEQIADRVIRLDDAVAATGPTTTLLLEPATLDAVAEIVRVCSPAEGAGRLWLTHAERSTLVSWRKMAPMATLIEQSRLHALKGGAERLAAQLRDEGIDGVLLDRSEWTGGLTTLFHRFGRLTVGGGATHERMITALLDVGIDGVVGDHPERLATAAVEIG